LLSPDFNALPFSTLPVFLFFFNEKDLTKANLLKSLFDKADFATQLRLVREETSAIALERFILPGRIQDAAEAYLLALERVSTTLTKGWFRDFAAANYPRLTTPDKDLTSIAEYVRAHPDDFAYNDKGMSKTKASHLLAEILVEDVVLSDEARSALALLVEHSRFFKSGNKKDTGFLRTSPNKDAATVPFACHHSSSSHLTEFEVHATLGEGAATLLHVTLTTQRIKGGGYWHDSGCEWSSGTWVREPDTIRRNVANEGGDRQAVQAAAMSLFGKELADQIPLAAIVAVLFRATGVAFPTNLRPLIQADTYQYLVPKENFARVWEHHNPTDACLQCLRFGMSNVNLSVIANLSVASLSLAPFVSRSASLKTLMIPCVANLPDAFLESVAACESLQSLTLVHHQGGSLDETLGRLSVHLQNNQPTAPSALVQGTPATPFKLDAALLNVPNRLAALTVPSGLNSYRLALHPLSAKIVAPPELREYRYRVKMLDQAYTFVARKSLRADFGTVLKRQASRFDHDVAFSILKDLGKPTQVANDPFPSQFDELWILVLRHMERHHAPTLVDARIGHLSFLALAVYLHEQRTGTKVIGSLFLPSLRGLGVSAALGRVLAKWRAAVMHNHGTFEYGNYQSLHGRALYADLNAAGCNLPWKTVETTYHGFLYGR
jgi:hypothetical protein